MKIAVAGTGYVGLSVATLLAQHNEVMAVDIVPEKVELINQRKSPIQDDYIRPHWMRKLPIKRQLLLSLQLLPTMTVKRIFLTPVRWRM